MRCVLTQAFAHCCDPSGVLGRWLDAKQVSMAVVFTQQSLFKHLLTQGDKIVLTWGSSLFDQGVYGVVTNYGSVLLCLPSRGRCGGDLTMRAWRWRQGHWSSGFCSNRWRK